MEGEVLPPRGNTNRSAPNGTGLFRELMVLGAGALVYFGGRKIVEGSRARAVRDAGWIIELEQRLGIDVERTVQRATDEGLLRTVGNISYVWLHWPLLIVVLVVLLRHDRDLYRRLRNAMFASGAVALVIFAVFPVAPPRFMPGFVGTVSDEARRHYVPTPLEWSNPYASFPSFHVGWTLVACLAFAAAVGRRRWAALAMVPAALVGVAVVSTGNHYVVDAIGGAVIALVAYWWAGRRGRRVEPIVTGCRADAAPGGDHEPARISYSYDIRISPCQSRPVSRTSIRSPWSSTSSSPNWPPPGIIPSL
jgi:membrane-associated phospholipid phosphatase